MESLTGRAATPNATAIPAGEDSQANWHARTADEVAQALTVDVRDGLSNDQAQARLARSGPNVLPQGEKKHPLMRLLAQFNNVLNYVLLVASFIKMMLGLWLDASIILAVVVLNALLGFFQEGRAEKALDAIRHMLSSEARVVREGHSRLISAADVVPGDVVLLESGDRVPADLRLVDVKNLLTDESALTGESVPVEKTVAVVAAKATIGDRHNLAFSGTMVVSGRATGVVVATGSRSELGRINQMLTDVAVLDTPLLRQIARFGYVITAVIMILAVVLFAWGHWLGHLSFVELFQAIVGITVSVIPEGLPALITITLAIGVTRMARRNAIIRRLPAVETLGAVSRICSDKTGTLTLMEMMVTSVVTAEGVYDVSGNGYAPEGRVTMQGQPADTVSLSLLGRVSLLCNDASLVRVDEQWKVQGDPTEGALYPFAAKLGMELGPETAAWPRWMQFRSSPITSSWRRSTVAQTDTYFWSRALPKSSWPTAIGSRWVMVQCPWIASVLKHRAKTSPRGANVCWRWPGCRTPAWRQATWGRQTYRIT